VAIETHCNLRLADVAPVILDSNYEAMHQHIKFWQIGQWGIDDYFSKFPLKWIFRQSVSIY